MSRSPTVTPACRQPAPGSSTGTLHDQHTEATDQVELQVPVPARGEAAAGGGPATLVKGARELAGSSRAVTSPPWRTDGGVVGSAQFWPHLSPHICRRRAAALRWLDPVAQEGQDWPSEGSLSFCGSSADQEMGGQPARNGVSTPAVYDSATLSSPSMPPPYIREWGLERKRSQPQGEEGEAAPSSTLTLSFLFLQDSSWLVRARL